MFYAPEKCKLKLNNLILNMTIDVMSLIRTDYVPEWRISAHAQSVLAAGQKHHNSSPLASACNMITNKELKR